LLASLSIFLTIHCTSTLLALCYWYECQLHSYPTGKTLQGIYWWA
jgi:hypothetical protein